MAGTPRRYRPVVMIVIIIIIILIIIVIVIIIMIIIVVVVVVVEIMIIIGLSSRRAASVSAGPRLQVRPGAPGPARGPGLLLSLSLL